MERGRKKRVDLLITCSMSFIFILLIIKKLMIVCFQEKSVEYLASVSEQLPSMPDIMQNVAIELIRKITRANPTEKVNAN